MRHLRQNCSRPEIDIFKNPEFANFHTSLDAEMKRLQTAGVGSIKKKQAEPLTMEDEVLCKQKLLGYHSPEALLNAMVYMNGLYFALRSGSEHRQLRHSPCQIQIIENPGERSYLRYTGDTSKNHPGGLKRCKQRQKVVIHLIQMSTILLDALFPVRPEKCSMYTRSFSLFGEGSGNETGALPATEFKSSQISTYTTLKQIK